MNSFFKDLLSKSYGERLEEGENINPFDRESLFSSPVSTSSCQNATVSILILMDNRVASNTLTLSGLETDSKISLDTFNHLLRTAFPETNVTQRLDYAKGNMPLDYSALINNLSKIFEIELNCSVVQWFRKKKGIEMPEYYNKYQPDKTVVYDAEDLNARRGGELATISIGKIVRMMDKHKGELPQPIQEAADEFLPFAVKLGKGRNASLHTEVVDESQFIEFYNRFCTFVREGWFSMFIELKESLRMK